MTKIIIPPEAVEAAYAAWWKSIKSGAMTERALNAAILAALNAWPGMEHDGPSGGGVSQEPLRHPRIILLLPQENTDDGDTEGNP